MQHREWNPKTFFKKVSPEVIATYEARRGLTLERDASKPAADQSYHAWRALPETKRLALETDLLPVNDLCTAHARPYLDVLARGVWANGDAHLIEKSKEWSIYDLAMRLHIDAPDEVLRVHQSYAVDMMEHFKEYRGKHPVKLKASRKAKERMRAEMVKHFREYAGGAQCQVEDFEGTDKFAIFIYHENEMTPVEQFDDTGSVVPIWQRPVARIAAVFYPDTCTLLIKAPRLPERERLRDLFAEIFVGEKDYFEDLTKIPKFNFAPLARTDFDFPTHPADGIESVCVTRVTMRTSHAEVKRMTVELMRNLSLFGVREALLKYALVIDGDLIDGVRMQFEFTQGKGRARFRTVSVHNPNSSNLRDTRRDRIIRRYLKEWGIDESRSAFAVAVPAVQAAAGV